MAMELKRKHDAVTDREIELRLHVRSKSCDPKQAKQVSASLIIHVINYIYTVPILSLVSIYFILFSSRHDLHVSSII